MTVNSMSAFFMPPKDLQLDELTNATLMKLELFRDKTSTGVCVWTCLTCLLDHSWRI